MRDLAVFEKFIDSFAITPKVVKESAFCKTLQDFHCIVAEDKLENKYLVINREILHKLYYIRKRCFSAW